MKDYEIRELVNQLRDVAIKYHGAGQLREQIARTVRAAILQAQSDDDGEPTDDERIMAIEGIHNCERCSDEGWVIGEMGITRCACGQDGNPPVIPGAEQRIADAVELLQKAAPAMLADNGGPDGQLAGRLKSPVIPGWVPVSERMPESNKFVLVSNGVWVGQGLYDDSEHLESDEHWQDEHREFINVLHHPVTHWMPLPAAPQEPKP